MSRLTCAYCGLPVFRDGAAGAEEDAAVYCCYGCLLVSRIIGRGNRQGPHAWNLLRLAGGAFLAMNVMMLSVLLYTGSVEAEAAGVFRWVLLALSAPAVAILGYPFALGAARDLARRPGGADSPRGPWAPRLSLDALIAVGSLTAFFVSAASTIRGRGHIYYDTATMLLVLVTFGKMIEATAKVRAGRLTDELEALLPAQAERLEAAGPRAVAAGELRVGDRVLVRPGGRFPADGVVMEGASTVLESSFTGEPGPRAVRAGDRVIAGTVNEAGALTVRAEAVGAGLLLARILESVREARERAAPFERAAERAAAVFTPATLLLAAAAGAAWLAFGQPARGALSALAVVVVACPCALGIAAPLAASIAIARAAREGVLVRGGEVLELAGRVATVFLDKTGTLTMGTPSVATVESLDPAVAEDELLGWLAGLESQSEHALARAAVAEARKRGLEIGAVGDLQATPGQGVSGTVTRGGATREVLAGSESFLENRDSYNFPPREIVTAPIFPPGPEQGPVVFVAWEGRVRGRVTFADAVRAGAAEAVAELRAMGVEVVLLSGDRREAAQAVARQVGIERVEAPCLPDEKLHRLRAAREAGTVAAMVGDGINDAPALAAAAVGIAIGAGTDLARQSGGAVLLSPRLAQVPWLLALGRRTRRIIRQNLAWAFGYNAVALAAAAAGVLHPLLAAVAMVVSSLTVLGNSLRIGAFPSPDRRRSP